MWFFISWESVHDTCFVLHKQRVTGWCWYRPYIYFTEPERRDNSPQFSLYFFGAVVDSFQHKPFGCLSIIYHQLFRCRWWTQHWSGVNLLSTRYTVSTPKWFPPDVRLVSDTRCKRNLLFGLVRQYSLGVVTTINYLIENAFYSKVWSFSILLSPLPGFSIDPFTQADCL